MTIQLFLDIEPQAVQSVRFTMKGRRYQPAKVTNYKLLVRDLAAVQLPEGWTVPTGSLTVTAVFRFAAPKSMSKAERAFIESGWTLPKPTRPDCDNLWKGTADALTGLCWQDDSQVVDLNVSKSYAASSGISIIIRQEEENMQQPIPTSKAVEEKPRWRVTWDYSSDGAHLRGKPTLRPPRITKPRVDTSTPQGRPSDHVTLF